MRTRIKKKKILLLLSAAAILLTGAILAFVLLKDNGGEQPEAISEGINLDPPTEENKQQVEQNKEELSKDKQSEPPPPPEANDGRDIRTPVITYVQQVGADVELTGYVPGIFEDGGTCKATFTKGSLSLAKETAGFEDVNRTSCTPFKIPASEFSQKGAWTVTLNYSSPTTTGTSEPVQIEVQ